jgi:uncharacterized protein (DUF1330 family)
MRAYVIVDLEVTDPGVFAEYREQVPATVAKYGGKFIVRGGNFEVLEGSWHPKRVVMLEFPSMEQAKKWYDSEDYRGPKAVRFKSSRANLVLVEGV